MLDFDIVDFFRAVFTVAQLGEETIRNDGLTGLLRREEALRCGEKVVRKALKQGLPISVVLIDMDELKEINDAQGHHKGDDLLRAVANIIRQECRAKRSIGDIHCRYGGDEFLIIMPSSDADGAESFVSRLRKKADTDGTKFSYGIEQISSFGLEAAIVAADRKMFEDKAKRKQA